MALLSWSKSPHPEKGKEDEVSKEGEEPHECPRGMTVQKADRNREKQHSSHVWNQEPQRPCSGIESLLILAKMEERLAIECLRFDLHVSWQTVAAVARTRSSHSGLAGTQAAGMGKILPYGNPRQDQGGLTLDP